MGASEDSANGSSPGVKPGALTALLKEIAVAPEEAQGSAWEGLLRAGAVVGRFEMVREVGHGGFGVVWEARDRELGRSVAFKAVRAGGKTTVREERLFKEAEAAARLQHPNIVTLHDVGRVEQGPYLILELLEGHTLAERRAQGTLSLREALRIGVEVAKGVAHAHAHGVVHRDLTPGNVFLCDDGQVKVLDFGMAHVFGQRKVDGGTRAYMAPEQARGAPEDERTDVFALGVILHEMLSGELPLPDAEALASSSPAPGLEVPEAPVLGELVGRMLEKDPVKRPRDAGEVLSALTAFQRELERLPSTGSVQVRTRRPSSGLRDLLAELKRRRVIRALLGWGIFSFAVLQVVEPVLHGLHSPDWVISFVVVLLALGFPVAIGLAWAFDLKTTGVERTPPAERPPGAPRRARARVALLLLGLSAAAGGAVFALRAWLRPPAPPPSIAVLPFADMSQQRDQEYFSDGMAEEILNALAHVDGLRVIGRTSSFSFKGRNDDLASIARKLAVGAILDGSVRKEANRVRVTAQLIDAADGSHLWSEAYDRELTSIFRVQEEIAQSVVAALRLKLLPGQAPTTRAAQTASTAAYTLVLRARHVSAAMNKDGYFKSHALLEQAAALDPAYATPHADMALTLRMMATFAGSPAEAEALRRLALAEAERSVALGPELDDAYSIRGLLRTLYQHDWAGAEADLRRSLALTPSHPVSLRRLGILQASLGRIDEGIVTVQRSTELDPLKASTWNWLGILQAAAGRAEAARASLARARELAPDSPEPRDSLALLELQAGNPAAALALVPSLNEDDALQITSMAEHDLGHDDASRRALERLIERHGHSDAQGVAEAYAWRGEADPAFEWLDRALGQELDGLKYSPILRRLRGDPRYTALLRKMNLPVD